MLVASSHGHEPPIWRGVAVRRVLWSSVLPIVIAGCQPSSTACLSGVHTLFSANFDNATTGGPPL
jgi:hypothetical protein